MVSEAIKVTERRVMRIRANVVRFSSISSPPRKKGTTKVGGPTPLAVVRDRGGMRHE
jgi:hypothetical protein